MSGRTRLVMWAICGCGLALLVLAACIQPRGGFGAPNGLVGAAGQGSAAVADRHHLLMHDGTKREYYVHLPAGHDGQSALPVVLAFHGGAGSADAQRRQSRMSEVSDRFGFLLVYPEGTGRAKTWNAGSCCGYAVRRKVDDVGFTAAMIDDLARNYGIDEDRVYATGMSNGGMLAYRLACELSDRIAAIAVVSGDLGVDGPQPGRPVPVLHIHGMKDPNVLFVGGVGPNQFQPVPHRSIPETIGFFVKANNCQPRPVETQQGDEFVMERYAPAEADAGAPVLLYKLPEGGHTWPGGSDITARFNTGRMIESFPASRIIWEFFAQFTLEGSVAAQ